MKSDLEQILEQLPHDAKSEATRMQVILAKKRTSLAVLRTGISVFTLPLSVTTVLIATSKYYDFAHNLHYLIPLLVLCVFLSVLGFYLCVRSMRAIQLQDRQLRKMVAAWERNNNHNGTNGAG